VSFLTDIPKFVFVHAPNIIKKDLQKHPFLNLTGAAAAATCFYYLTTLEHQHYQGSLHDYYAYFPPFTWLGIRLGPELFSTLKYRSRVASQKKLSPAAKIDLQNLPPPPKNKTKKGLTTLAHVLYDVSLKKRKARDYIEDISTLADCFPTSSLWGTLRAESVHYDELYLADRAKLQAYRKFRHNMPALLSFLFHRHLATDKDPLERAFHSYLVGHFEETRISLEASLNEPDSDQNKTLLRAEISQELADALPHEKDSLSSLRKTCWKRTLPYIQNSERQQLSESRNKVYEPTSSNQLKETSILKEGTSDSINEEKEVARIIKEILEEKYKGYFVSTPVETFEEKGSTFCVIRREPGRNLDELLRSPAEETSQLGIALLPAITDALALIHVYFPLEKCNQKESEPGEYPLTKTWNDLEERIGRTNVDEGTKKRILDNTLPLKKILADSLLVFKKDPHPKNWRYGDNGQVGVLDCELLGRTLQPIELVTLLEYLPIPEPVKKECIARYLNRFNEHAALPVEDVTDFNLKYRNATIYRALAVNASLQDKDPKALERKTLLTAARRSPGKIKKEHPAYYNQYRKEYVHLYLGIRSIMKQGIQ